MNNCFTFTYKELLRKGVNLPTEFTYQKEVKDGDNISIEDVLYTTKDMRLFVKDFKYFLKNKIHYKFFESFCEYVTEAQEGDIIISKDGVGIAANKYKFVTMRDSNKSPCLDNIKGKKILRVNNG